MGAEYTQQKTFKGFICPTCDYVYQEEFKWEQNPRQFRLPGFPRYHLIKTEAFRECDYCRNDQEYPDDDS